MAQMKYAIITIVVALVSVFSEMSFADPIGYAINSDSGSDSNFDSLYRIDLATGEHTYLGTVQSLGVTRTDVEGLAFSPDGTLYGTDDDYLTLSPINIGNGAVISEQEVFLNGLASGGNNDFGLAFACDGNLYATSSISNSLYRINTDGNVALIGTWGAGINISSLAAYGNPIQLYGLSNGLKGEELIPDTRSLYSINPQTGAAALIGPLEGGVASYGQTGLDFDKDGQLWAITDRSSVPESPYRFGSQILRIDKNTGNASLVSTTKEQGFENLAIAVPQGCAITGPGEYAEFTVQTRFADGNDITPVRLNIKCTNGLPLEQSFTALPDQGFNGNFEVKFIVESFIDGALDCEVWEDTLGGYRSEYECQANNICSNKPAGSCEFEDVSVGETNHCLIQNYVMPVEFTISKQWLYHREDTTIDSSVRVEMECSNVMGGDGDYDSGTMRWNWLFSGDNDQQTASLQPDFAGNTRCFAIETVFGSAVESDQACATPTTVEVGDGPHLCLVTNTVFFEGIPTLNHYGMLVYAALILITGIVAKWQSSVSHS